MRGKIVANDRPLPNATISLRRLNLTIGNQSFTDSEGDFQVHLDPAIELDNPIVPVDLVVTYRDYEFIHRLSEEARHGQTIVKLSRIPLTGFAKIEHQPLGTKNSVATFDLIITNVEQATARVHKIELELRVTDKDCITSQATAKAIDKVSRVVTVDVDDGLSTLEDKNSIVRPAIITTSESGLCAKIDLTQEIDVAKEDTKRIRFDVVSPNIRAKFYSYSHGELPYNTNHPRIDQQYVGIPRLQHPDLRYYLIDAKITVLAPGPGFADGSLKVQERLQPGAFPKDIRTLKR